MNVQEIDFPEKFRPIIRRLQTAAQEKEVRNTMTIEDDFIAELNDYEHRIAVAIQEKEKALLQQAEERSLKEEALRKQAEALRKEEEALRKEEEALRKEEEALRKEEEALQKQAEERAQKLKAVSLLLQLGMSKEEIAQQLGLSLEDLE